MTALRSAAAVSALVITSVGCSTSVQGSGSTLPPPSALRQPGAMLSRTPQYLYVSGSDIGVYEVGRSKPIRLIRDYGGGAMAFDSAGNLYVSDGAFEEGHISVYAAGTRRLLRRIENVFSAISLAVDGRGYLYVANGGGIDVYAPGKTQIFRTIVNGAGGSDAIAFDRSGNLYSANQWHHDVTVYAPSKKPAHFTLLHKITGIHEPVALAFGPSGDLFVGAKSAVYVFAAGTLSPLRTLTDGVYAASAIDVDSIGRLYVACDPFRSKGGFQAGWVSVYAAGHAKRLRKITEGMDVPSSIAIDAQDNVYVANSYDGSVTVFDPGGAKLLRTITDGISGPRFLAFSLH